MPYLKPEGGSPSPHKAQGGQVLPIPTVCTKGLLGHEGVSMASQLLFLPTQPAWLSWAMMVREIQTGKIYTPAFLFESLLSGAPTFSVAKMPQSPPMVLPLTGGVTAFGFGPFRHPDRRV